MEQNHEKDRLELLCVRPAPVCDPMEMRRTGMTKAGRRFSRRKNSRAAILMRRGTAVCLSALLLTSLPVDLAKPLEKLALRLETGIPAVTSETDTTSITETEPYAPSVIPVTNVPEDPPDEPSVCCDGWEIPVNPHADPAMLPEASAGSQLESVKALTVAASSGGQDTVGGITILNGTKKTVSASLLPAIPAALAAGFVPTVLIYHTHACESYTPGALDTYETDASDRCTDPAYSVIRVGDEMAKTLEDHGIRVIHDRTQYDGESYNGAYTRSLAGVQAVIAQDPTVLVAIDVHRDALNQPGAQKYKLVADADGQTSAQVMLVIGTDESAGDHPGWRDNLALALMIQQKITDRYPTLARPLKLTRSSYHQFLAPGAMLVEVGANGNELGEAILAGRLFAEALAEILTQTVSKESGSCQNCGSMVK